MNSKCVAIYWPNVLYVSMYLDNVMVNEDSFLEKMLKNVS